MLSLTAVANGQKKTPVANNVGCQERFTLGKDYTGQGNTTVSGLACRKWSDTERGAFLGDHNYCRNPYMGNQGVFSASHQTGILNTVQSLSVQKSRSLTFPMTFRDQAEWTAMEVTHTHL